MRRSVHYLFIAVHGIIAGFIVLGGRYFSGEGLSLYEISVLTLIPPTCIFGALVLAKRKYRFKREHLPSLLFYGLTIAGTVLAQFGAVILGTPVAVVAFLLYTQPFWTILFARILFGERLGRVKIIACGLVLCGVVFLVQPFGVSEETSPAGIIVALFGGLSLSLYVVWGGILSKRGNSIINTSFSGSFFAILYMMVLLPLLRIFTAEPNLVRLSVDFSGRLWAVLIVYSVVTLGINSLFYLEGIKKVPVTDAGIILLLEPVSGALLAAVLFHEPLTPFILAGAVLILSANYLVIRAPTIAP